ncbi:MAG TPA: radical SAM family heme chaperone HemW [Acidimicrobiales bacterium]|nr:radical SAM family heme chaperone HemW [Acidimicrobiales bacterium]
MAFGVYVHIPFCSRRCDYCAFATWTDRHHLMAAYAAACRREVIEAGLDPATSVFFGGGTPSLLPADLLTAMLGSISMAPGAEVTVECNPETVSPELLVALRGAGVNRLSFGVQSMVPHVLAGLGRDHDPATVRNAVRWARDAGFEDSFNVDLIYGGAGESVDDWGRTLDEVLALDPPHVSAYALTVEPGTPLAADPRRHPDDDDQADKYTLADSKLGDAGLAWYELSNWARPGHECRHNQLYWAQGDYRGIGCAAHSHQGGRRWWNVRTPERYLRAVATGRSPIAGEERLDPPVRALEALQLALRTRDGVPAAALPDDPGLAGLVRRSGSRARLSLQGRLLENEVAARLVDPASVPG